MTEGQRSDLIAWVDVETTGLAKDALILEVAVVLTDRDLDEVARFESVVAHSWNVLSGSFENLFVFDMHRDNGLIEDVLAGTARTSEVEHSVRGFLSDHAEKGSAPLAGSSVHSDRAWLAHSMPSVESLFHYRNLDTSGMTRRAEWWAPKVSKKAPRSSDGNHRAMADILDTIALERYFKEALFDSQVADG